MKSVDLNSFRHINPKILNAIAKHSHNRRLPAELIQLFSKDLEDLLIQCDQALAIKDRERIHFLAHRIRGSALNVGAQSMANICSDIEKTMAKKYSWSQLSTLIERLRDCYKTTQVEFLKYLHKS